MAAWGPPVRAAMRFGLRVLAKFGVYRRLFLLERVGYGRFLPGSRIAAGAGAEPGCLGSREGSGAGPLDDAGVFQGA